jgi:ATP-dependent protease ClpP protease subunit
VPAVTELVVAQLMYLEWMNSKEPVYIYINSTGTARDDGEPVSKLVQLMACGLWPSFLQCCD